MEKVIQLKNFKELKNKKSNYLARHAQGYVENVLRPATLSGVIVPWTEDIKDGRESDYKLVCKDGREYFFVTDSYWESVLSWYSWDDVTVKGLLNTDKMTLIPQKIFPKGPTAENDNVIDLVVSKTRGVIKKIGKNLNELVIIPAGLLAVMMAL